MKFSKSTALTFLLGAMVLTFAACNKDSMLTKKTEYLKSDIIMTGAQNVPVSTATALGSMTLAYSTTTKILTYTITWSGLTGAVASAGISGMAPYGYPSATVVQTFNTANIVKCSTFGTTSCGTYKGTLLADGVVVTEDNLLNGVYYVGIRTAANPAGELRAQIKF
jgi:hypothetical protein